jgi:hypothetical protein
MTASDQHDMSSRVEREVREILERAEAKPAPVDAIQSAVRRQTAATRSKISRSSTSGWSKSSISSEVGRIVIALVLAVAAAGISGYSHLLAVIMAIGSAIILFSLWVPARSQNGDSGPRWRGRDLRDRGSQGPFGRRK